MAKTKVVIKLPLNGKKSWWCSNTSLSKARQIAVGVPGVESLAVQGQDKNQIEVTGDGIDAFALTKLLRKNMGFAELVSVTPAGDKVTAAPPKPTEPAPVILPSYQYGAAAPFYMYEVESSHAPPCSIL